MTNFLMDRDIHKVLMPIQKMIDRDFEKKLNDKFEKFEMEAPWPEDFGVRREFSLTQATVEYIREKQDRCEIVFLDEGRGDPIVKGDIKS